ncbi:MAG: hypothetical protein ACYTKD_30805, partial [Planctomycetota bacterium]
MGDPLDWGILIVAGSSLIFALIALKHVLATTSRVDGFLDRVEKVEGDIATPEFISDVIVNVITKGA